MPDSPADSGPAETIDERNARFHALGIKNAEFNNIVAAMRSQLDISDGDCRRALFALGLAGYWPAPMNRVNPAQTDRARKDRHGI